MLDAYGVEMVFVPGGEFTMGGEDGNRDEKPVHRVYVDAFYMDKYEVTNALYAACVNEGGCSQPHDPVYYNDAGYTSHPVVYVDWNQAVGYCRWRGARLPSEAEWEKAARGPDERTYPWGEDLDCSKANYIGCNGGTSAVGSHENSASPYGAYDLSGNAWEWVADWYDGNYYETLGGNACNPPGPASGKFRVLRGGAWLYNEFGVRSSNRDWLEPTSIYMPDGIGFRCALSAP